MALSALRADYFLQWCDLILDGLASCNCSDLRTRTQSHVGGGIKRRIRRDGWRLMSNQLAAPASVRVGNHEIADFLSGCLAIADGSVEERNSELAEAQRAFLAAGLTAESTAYVPPSAARVNRPRPRSRARARSAAVSTSQRSPGQQPVTSRAPVARCAAAEPDPKQGSSG